MKPLMLVLLMLAAFHAAAADLYLRPKPGLPGHDAVANEIRVHELAANGDFWIQVVVAGNEEPISAAQVEVAYPAHWIFVDSAEPLRPDSNLSNEYVAFLPSNPNGEYQDDLIENELGKWRAMMVLADFQSHLRPSPEPQVLFEMRFRAAGRTQASCSSSEGRITVKPAGMDPLHGTMVLNHRAALMSFSLTAHQPVMLTHEGVRQKGNLTRYLPGGNDEDIDFDDLAVLLRCISTDQRGCGLAGLSEADYHQLTDLDCSGGAPNWSDLNALRLLIGRSPMPAAKKSNALTLQPEQGSFALDLADYPGGLALQTPRNDTQALAFLDAVQDLAGWRATLVDQPGASLVVMLLPDKKADARDTHIAWPASRDRALLMIVTALSNNTVSFSEQE